MSAIGHCGRVISSLLLSAGFFASIGQAANPLTALALEPATTLIAILDKERKLTGEGNRRLFAAAGFKVAILGECIGGNEIDCLRDHLPDLKRRNAVENILLMTAAPHTQTVAAIYKDERLRRLISGIILFRAQAAPLEAPEQKMANALPLLIFGKIEDDKDAVLASRRFADHMRRRGVPSWFYLLSDRTSAERAIKVVYHFMGARRDRDAFQDFLTAHALWQQKPLLDHAGFRRHPEFISDHAVDGVFLDAMRDFFFLDRPQLKKWELKRFAAFDILAYRDSHAATRNARYLVLRNHLGHLGVIDLRLYAEYEPVIVVGIDDVKNLFRLHYFYRTKAGYSWIEGEQPRLSVRPLGAFLYFRKPVPEELEVRFAIRSKLSFDSIAFASENPLASLDSLSPRLKKTMTLRHDCIYCHELDGVGGRAQHLVAVSGERQPGYALPLRSYSKAVLNSFLFDQDRVAAKIGAIPNPVPAEQAKELFDFLTEQ